MTRTLLLLAACLLAGGCARPADRAAPAPASSPTPAAGATADVRPAWAKHFDAYGATGAFVLYDAAQHRYLRYNPERCAQRFLPASTFKIFNSLVALETGVLKDTSEVLPWDGVDRGNPAWNRDHTLRSAFQVSAVWFYQEVARRIGPERMRAYVTREGYGNQDLSGGIDQFWLRGGLRISPDEQVALLRKLHDGTLGFSARTLALVRGIMVMEEGEGYVLRGKTGWGVVDGVDLGWLVGYVEKGGTPYFFAMNLESTDPDFPMVEARRAITFGILEELGLRAQAP